jgi:hypothetical protein
MTIAGQDILTLIVVALISFLAGAVKTIMAYTRNRILPKKLDFIVNIILSFFIGILSGWICTYFQLPDNILYVVVALSALSAERLLSAIPTIFVKRVEVFAGVSPTREDYESDPINQCNREHKD